MSPFKPAKLAIWLLACALILCAPVRAARIKDITTVEGIRTNQLYGFGLVVGLAGTGGGSDFTAELTRNMLERMRVGRGLEELDADNISAVVVTADLPPFAREGTRIDVTVSALDEATSLRGGSLLLTPLMGADGQVHAVAQGPLMVGGFSFGGEAATVSQGHPTVGRISGGATIEQDVHSEFLRDGTFTLCLNAADFATARRIAEAVRAGADADCTVIDAGTVRVRLDETLTTGQALEEIARVQALEVIPDTRAVVVINERTGTIVAGQNVGIASVAISHGNLTVITREEPEVVQPRPFSSGTTERVERTEITILERPVQAGGLTVVRKGTTVSEVARALNALGAGPRDIISIFQAIKEAGALHAELRVM